MESKSLDLCKGLLGKEVRILIDRPLGSKHPKWNFKYTVNYGYVPGIIAPDGEELDAYVLNVDYPVKEYSGIVVAIVHRLENDDDKIVIIPENSKISDQEIETTVEFQEKWFKHSIIRK